MDPRLLSYLQKILNAQVYDVAIESALEKGTKLSQRLGNNIWLKREDTQPVRSFKLRGAYNKMSKLSTAELEKGVICAQQAITRRESPSAHSDLGAKLSS